MATETKTKIKDFYSPFANPAGGVSKTNPNPFAALFGGLFNAPPISYPTLGSYAKPAPVQNMTPLPPNMSTPKGPVYAPPPVMPAAPARAAAAPAPAPVAPSRAPAPVAAPAAPVEETPVPRQWLKADGTIKTPDEIAADMGSTLKSLAGTGDIGRMAGAQFGADNRTTEELETEARRIGNVRNDIAVGETDPYKVASQSGIAYTPAELSAIEKAYAGIYDPALDSAMSKVEARKSADAEVAKWEQELKKMAVQHGYDLEKMEKDQNFQKGLVAYKAALEASGGGAGQMTPYSDERSQRTVQSVDQLLPQVDANPGIFGRSAAAPIPDFLRSDAYRNFKTELDTLKASIAFNELTAMREASKTGGALGNVSNIELGLLESALGALNMSQTPENFKEQLTKVKDSINRWRTAQGAAAVVSSPGSGGGGPVPAGTDGAAYGFPGYVSDGTQWVAK